MGQKNSSVALCRALCAWDIVGPYIHKPLRYLRVTQEGKQWVANLHASVPAALDENAAGFLWHSDCSHRGPPRIVRIRAENRSP